MNEISLQKLNKFFTNLMNPEKMFDNQIRRIELSATLYDYLIIWANTKQSYIRFTQIKGILGIPVFRNESLTEFNYEFVYDTHNQIFSV